MTNLREFKAKKDEDYQITNSVPMPEKKGHKYPFDTMKVGDSFAVGSTQITALRSAVTYFKNSRGGGTNFSIRKLPNGEVRIWRIS